MADEPAKYKRLPGRGGGVFGTSTLWTGPDHLMLVQSYPAGESYRRFFFRDIQAIIIRQTYRRFWINVVMLLLAALSALPIANLNLNSADNQALAAILGCLSGFWLLLAAVNTIKGPACTVHIQTPVQTEIIRSLRRIGKARRVLSQVRPLIAAAQQGVAPAAPLETSASIS